eukprot:COSAG02_NODE_1214_length_13857_cov_17.738334_2_plen_397_part_00
MRALTVAHLCLWCMLHACGSISTVGKQSSATNRFGIGIYNDTAAPPLAQQLPEAAALVGEGGHVLLYFNLLFSTNGEPASCLNDCLPLQWQLDAVHQAYALNLSPFVRLGQWSRTIRDFADGSGSRSSYTQLAQQYRRFAAALPLPPDGKSSLAIQLLNEPNVCGEWQCKEPEPGAHLLAGTAAAEVASCLRDLVVALRPLPRLALSLAPLAQVGFERCECSPPFIPIVKQNATQVSFANAMLAAVPELYDQVDFLCVHAYPYDWHQSFESAAGRAGIESYQNLRDLVTAHRHTRGKGPATAGALPIVVGETGWQGPNQTLKAESIVTALKEVFFRDPYVIYVLPFMLANWAEDYWPWTNWTVNVTRPIERHKEWLAMQALRCNLGIGGANRCPRS